MEQELNRSKALAEGWKVEPAFTKPDVNHYRVYAPSGNEVDIPAEAAYSAENALDTALDMAAGIQEFLKSTHAGAKSLATYLSSPYPFNVIEADPAWKYRVWSGDGQGRNAGAHYDIMEDQDILALGSFIKFLAAPDAVLFLWATWPLLVLALEVGAAWGFEYKTCAFDWIKITRNAHWHFGMGHWTRANSEPCLLFTKGRPQRQDKGVAQIVSETPAQDFINDSALVSPILSHSRKPEAVYERIEQLLGDQRRLRLFARDERPGWVSLGNALSNNPIDYDLSQMCAALEKQ